MTLVLKLWEFKNEGKSLWGRVESGKAADCFKRAVLTACCSLWGEWGALWSRGHHSL